MTDAGSLPPQDKISILYVDDEPQLLEICRLFLERLGEFKVSISTSAREALDRFQIQTYDAIVSDYQMPGMDGIEFLMAVREQFGDIPFILFTGRGREEVVIEAINHGADFYLQKGGDPKAQFVELAHKIRQAVKRRQAEDELILLKTSVDQAYDEVFWLDFKGNILYVNEAACRTTGYSKEELRRMKIFTLDPDFSPEVWAQSVADLRQGKNQFITTRHRRKDGTTIDVEIMASYVKKGDSEYSFAFVHDISERKRAEETIARSKDYLDQIFSSVKAGIVIINSLNHEIEDINPAACEMIGLPKEQIIGDICHKFLCSAETSDYPIPIRNTSVDNIESILNTRDGKKIPIIKYISRINVDGRECFLATFIDNSERIQAEEARQESEIRYQELADLLPQIVFETDMDLRITYANRHARILLGLTDEDLNTEINVFSLIDPAQHEEVRDSVQKIINGVPFEPKEYTALRKDGNIFPVIIYSSPIYRDKILTGFRGVVVDISARKKMEHDLRESEEKFRGIAERTSDLILIIDKDKSISYASPSSGLITGYDSEELIGKTLDLAAKVFSACLHEFMNVVEITMNGLPAKDIGLQIRKKDGTTAFVDINTIPVFHDDVFSGVQVLIRDSTERRRVEMTLCESEEKFRTIFENSPYPIAINSLPDNKFLAVNSAFKTISGYTEAEILGKDPMEMGLLNIKEGFKLISRRLISGKIENVPLALTAKEGRRVHVLFSTLPVTINNKPATMTVTTEITKMKRIEEELIRKNNELNAAYEELTAIEEELRQKYDQLSEKEQALRESSETLQAVVEQSNEGIIIVDLTGKLLYSNRRAAEIFDSDEDLDTTGKINIMNFLTQDLQQNTFNVFSEISHVLDRCLVTYKIITLAGKEKWIDCIGRNITIKESPAMLLSFRDTTERTKAEKELRDSEFKFLTIFKSNPVPLTLVSTTEGIFTDVNDAFLRSTGYILTEVVGKKPWEMGIFADDEEYARLAAEIQEKHFVHGMELKCRNKAGEIRTCRFSSSVILIDEKPQILSTIEDITESRQITDRIRESEERYRLILKNANEAIMVNELTPRGPGKFIDANESACRILGMTYEELQNVSLIDLDTPEMKKRAPEIIREIKQNQHSVFQTNYLTKDNREKIIDISVSLFDLKGSQTMLSVVRDITDQKASESALNALVSGMVGTTGRESLDNITESISEWLGADCIMIGELTPDQEYVRVLSMILDGKKIQDYSYTLKGTPCENTLKKGFCIYPDNVAGLFPESRDLQEFNIQGYVGTVLRNSEGQALGILSILTRNPLNLPHSAREINDIIAAKASAEIERMKALRALSESEEKFRALVEHSLDGTLILDPQGNILFANNAAVKIIDAKNPEDIIGIKNVMEFIAPDSQDDAIRDFNKVAQGVDGYIAQYKILTVDHEKKWVESIGKSIVFQSAGSILISIRDITDRKRAEKVLQITSNELQQIFRNMINAFVVWESIFDEEGKYVSFRFGKFNDAYARIFKLNYRDVRGKDVFEVWPENELSWVEVYGCVALTGIPQVFDMYHEPTKGWYHCNAYRPTDSSDRICAIFEDITERRLMDEALRQAYKKLNLLSSITRHDILNKISVIFVYLGLAEMEYANPALKEYLRVIKTSTDEIQSQIEFTRVYQDLGSQEPQWFLLDAVMPRSFFPVSVTLTTNLQGISIFADPMLERVFFNLLDNSIRHGQWVSEIRVSTYESENNLIVVWEDNGIGINEEEKECIFEHGFGRNTGFGMFLVREVLSLNGISIRETGVPGKGARFEITVPKSGWRTKE